MKPADSSNPEFPAELRRDAAEPPAVRGEDQPPNSAWRLRWSALYLLLLAIVFSRSLFSLAAHASGEEIHSHIVLIPFVSAYLVYIGWSDLPRNYYSSPILAAIMGLIGAGALLAAYGVAPGILPLSHNDHLALVAFAIVCWLAAGGFALLGSRWMKAAMFPVGFLLFMVPLPDGLVTLLETASKYGSAETTHLFFNLFGVPYLRDGLVFQLPGIVIEVAQECSGIRSSWVLFITSLLAAHLFLRTTWRQAVLVFFVIPLGLLRNGFRILTISILCVEIGPEMIHSFLHRRGGPLFFALSLIPLSLLLWGLRATEQKKQRPESASDPG